MRRNLVFFVSVMVAPMAMAATCDTGYELSDIPSNYVEPARGGKCQVGYEMYSGNWNNEIVFASNGSHCAIGYYPTANGCTAYPTDDCPDNYFTTQPTNIFIRKTGETCANNYEEYNDTDFCLQYLGADMADLCTPQLACTGGARTFKVSGTDIEIPIYDDMATHPSLTFKFGNNHECFMNMTDGVGEHTVNVNYNNNTYHGAQ